MIARRTHTLFAWLIILGLLVFIPQNSWADQIILKDGSVVYGQILRQSRTDVTIRSNDRTQVIQKTQIARIQYGVNEPQPVVEEPTPEPEPPQTNEPEETTEPTTEAESESTVSEPETTEIEPTETEPGESDWLDFLGQRRFYLGLTYHAGDDAHVSMDDPVVSPELTHPFASQMRSESGAGMHVGIDQDVFVDFFYLNLTAGATRRSDALAPVHLSAYKDAIDLYGVYERLSGTEFYLRPGFGLRFAISEALAVALQFNLHAGVVQMDYRIVAYETTANALLEATRVPFNQPERWHTYRFHNPEYQGPSVSLAFDFQNFRLWVGRNWLEGSASGSSFTRDEWITGVAYVWH
ncbi:MAG: hypothetical protein KDK30_08805 [Leptospiraceae bacterium]|nr:hypothetical protein [Leptospiraceae bacterium]MCB1322406.1 hypothetical protein [Leptospiraceae bacterium]